jgi:ATP-dependent Lhr-like helicase
VSGFQELHPAIQHHIVNSLEWKTLRPLQEQAVDPILRGEHVILLAPTAGGKTEAAIFPILSRMLTEDWSGLSVLYVCPIKALLNNLEPRLREYAELVGRRVGIWHGDVRPAARKRILDDPPDLLLTTPESIEVMLTSTKTDHRKLFADLQAVIVDEMHAFAGDDRGWHLLSVVERLRYIADRDIQRLGLSATVGNAEELLTWLSGSSKAACAVVSPIEDQSVAVAETADVSLDYVGSLPNAATIIARLHAGEKRLVFCDSRSRVESLAALLAARYPDSELPIPHRVFAVIARRPEAPQA